MDEIRVEPRKRRTLGERVRFPVGSIRECLKEYAECGEMVGIGHMDIFPLLPRPSFGEAKDAVGIERKAISEVERRTAEGSSTAESDVLNEMRGGLWGEKGDLGAFDIGVFSASLALAAAGAFPTGSCNMRMFGDAGEHHDWGEGDPVVGFCCTPAVADVLEAIARRMKGRVALKVDKTEGFCDGDCVLAFGTDRTALVGFAEAIVASRHLFRAIPTKLRAPRLAVPSSS